MYTEAKHTVYDFRERNMENNDWVDLSRYKGDVILLIDSELPKITPEAGTFEKKIQDRFTGKNFQVITAPLETFSVESETREEEDINLLDWIKFNLGMKPGPMDGDTKMRFIVHSDGKTIEYVPPSASETELFNRIERVLNT